MTSSPIGTDEELIVRLRKYGHIEAADALLSRIAEVERLTARVSELERALELMPDDIETFRLMRLGGRNRADQARVVASRIQSVRSATLSQHGKE